MQVTDEMARVAIQRANQLGYDLPHPLVELMLTAALAAMQDHVIVPREPNVVALDAIILECEAAWGIGSARHLRMPLRRRAELREIAKPFYRAAISPAPSQLSKRDDAERDSIQEA